MTPYLSVIIPAFNEEQRIGKTLREVDGYLRRQQYVYEIIVVNDGSRDNTASAVREMQHTVSHLKLTELPVHTGKGAAVKAGMLAAHGEARLFMDADSSTATEEVEKLLPPFSEGVHVVVGSRLFAGAVKKIRQNLAREFLGWVFRRITHALVKTEVEDTQNGFKLFSQSATKQIFTALQTTGWSFDVEVLALARKFNLKVKEIPIVWVNDNHSKLRFLHMIQMLIDLIRISWKYRT